MEWCNSFVLVSKPSGKVRLCPDFARVNQALVRPVLRGSTLNDIFPKLYHVKYLSPIDASSGYDNLKLERNHHTSQHLHANLAGTETRDFCMEQSIQGICLNEK